MKTAVVPRTTTRKQTNLKLPGSRTAAPGAAEKPAKTAPRLKSLLVPVDFSECSLRALDYAVSLARQTGGQITLVHAVEPRKVFNDSKSAYADWDAWMLQTSRNQLNQLATDRIEELIPVRVELRIGRSYEVICELARRGGTDLIIIGTHGRTGLKRLFLGSTAERVVRFAPCSVLVVRGKEAGGDRRFAPRKILVPLDFSGCSKKAVQYAVGLAEAFQARLQLVHVVPTQYASGDFDYFDYAMLESELKHSAEKELVATAKRIHARDHLPVETMILHGRPATEIAQAAQGMGADLIVISTHGRTGIEHALLGSTTEAVVRHAHCPVLTLRLGNRVARAGVERGI